MITRRAYIARYPINANGNELDEEIIATDTYWSPRLSETFDRLAAARGKREPMLQGWYTDENGVECMATTNQPFRLP